MNEQDLSILTSESKRIIQSYLNKGNTVHKLAKKAGIQSSQIWLFMQGKRGLTDQSLEKIGKAILK